MSLIMDTEVPRFSKTVPMKGAQRIKLFLRPTEDKSQYYRFRLLNFRDPAKNDRDYPYIVRYVHRVFGKDENGKAVVKGEIVCPVTKFSHWAGDPYKECPICNYSGRQFQAFKQSKNTDKVASAKSREFGRKFEAWVPVYVVNDPLYDVNNGKLKAFCFTNKDEYTMFDNLVRQKAMEETVFGPDAVDFCIRLAKEHIVENEGEPNERTYDAVRVREMGFKSKPTHIDAITSEAISEFEFDDQLYVVPTKEQLNDFYNKFCKMTQDDDDDPFGAGSKEDNDLDVAAVKPAAKATPTIVSSKTEAPARKPAPKEDEPKETFDTTDEELDEMFGTEKKVEEKKAPPKEAAKTETKGDDVSEDEIDAILGKDLNLDDI